ncbi:MAG: hypothetical protein ACRYGF_06485 [Janthinobacterium lividum]
MSFPPKQRLVWAQRQAYIALDVSLIEGFIPDKVDAILDLPANCCVQRY